MLRGYWTGYVLGFITAICISVTFWVISFLNVPIRKDISSRAMQHEAAPRPQCGYVSQMWMGIDGIILMYSLQDFGEITHHD